MQHGRPSEWPVLFDIAVQILRYAEEQIGFPPSWSFGGGTALMLQIDHRESHDIDLFLDDPQLLPFLNPDTQGIKLERKPDSYSVEGMTVLKLVYSEIGEIDFIVCADITEKPSQMQDIRSQLVALETPAEIIAKKAFYRGWSFQPRDMLDLAAVADHHGSDYAVAALSEAGREACEKALGVVESATPDFVQSINAQLRVRDATRHLIPHAQEISKKLLEQALLTLAAAPNDDAQRS